MTIRKGRKRRGPGSRGPKRQLKASRTRRQARRHIHRVVCDHGTAASGPSAESGKSAAVSQAVAQRLQPDFGSDIATPVSIVQPPEARRAGAWLRTGQGRLLTALLLPGLTFVEMGRPAASLACHALQASLLGWLPAVVWAGSARRHVARKQKQLAARLR